MIDPKSLSNWTPYALAVLRKSPGKDKEPNCLPAPKGPFDIIMRLYWPKEAALDGTWKQPPMKRGRVVPTSACGT